MMEKVLAFITAASPVLSALAASGFGLKYLFDRRRRLADARKINSEGRQADAGAEVAISGATLAWAQRADERAEAAIGRAERAESKIDDLKHKIDDLEDALELCRAQVLELIQQLARCSGGTPCPNRSIVPPPPPGVRPL